MNITKLSRKGKVIIPKPVRSAHHWKAGQELVVIDVGEGILLKPKIPFKEISIDDVASCLNYLGTSKTLDEMNDAIKQGVKEHYNGID